MRERRGVRRPAEEGRQPELLVLSVGPWGALGTNHRSVSMWACPWGTRKMVQAPPLGEGPGIRTGHDPSGWAPTLGLEDRVQLHPDHLWAPGFLGASVSSSPPWE